MANSISHRGLFKKTFFLTYCTCSWGSKDDLRFKRYFLAVGRRARVEAERPGQGSFHRTAKWPWLDSEWQGSGERGKFCTGFEHRTSRIS